jgi:hypothetical protein
VVLGPGPAFLAYGCGSSELSKEAASHVALVNDGFFWFRSYLGLTKSGKKLGKGPVCPG